MNSRRCMISSFEFRTYSATTPGKAQSCQLYGPNQEPKARSDFVLAHILSHNGRPSYFSINFLRRLRAPCGHDPTSAIFNDARLFELAGYQSHRRPPDPEHLRQELLG